MAGQNPMRRKMDPDSPIWIPLLINLFVLFIMGCSYIYNAPYPLTYDQVKKIGNPEKPSI